MGGIPWITCVFLSAGALFATLPACTHENETIFCDADGDCTTSPPASCPSGTLGYDPAWSDGEALPRDTTISLVASRLDPFSAKTSCKSVVVGFSNDGDCAIPASKITVVTFDSSGKIPTEVPTTAVFPDLEPSSKTATPTNTAFELRFPIPTLHEVGAYPVVGVVLSATSCAVEFVSTCDDRALKLKSNGDWLVIPGTSYYFGLDECAPK